MLQIAHVRILRNGSTKIWYVTLRALNFFILYIYGVYSIAEGKKEIDKLLGRKPSKGDYSPSDAISDVELKCSTELQAAEVCKYLLSQWALFFFIFLILFQTTLAVLFATLGNTQKDENKAQIELFNTMKSSVVGSCDVFLSVTLPPLKVFWLTYQVNCIIFCIYNAHLNWRKKWST